MKKVLTLSIAVLALVAFAAMPAFAGPGCASAKKASASNSCSSTDAVKTAAKGETCDINACAAKAMDMSKEDFAKMCADGKMAVHTISIDGMTCGGCEKSVTTALEKIDGVNKVVSISHKDKMAIVCVNPKKVNTSALTKAVTAKGFTASIVPAVSKDSKGSSTCAKTCSPAEKAACGTKDKKADGTN